MKYIDALRKYNEGKDKWCIPRKGTEDYLKIRMMMRMKSKIFVKVFVKVFVKDVIIVFDVYRKTKRHLRITQCVR